MLRHRSRSPGGASIERIPSSVTHRPPFMHNSTDDFPSDHQDVQNPQIRVSDFGARDTPDPYRDAERPLLSPARVQHNAPSLLRRLGTLNSPRSPIGRMLTRKRTEGEAYDRLGDEEGDLADMPITVDISSLAGVNIELSNVGEIDQPKMNMLQSIEEHDPATVDGGLRGLGDGMIIGAQLSVDPSAVHTNVPTASSQALSANARVLQRAKTIRERGQQEAQKLGAIVAVQQPVDLSSYDGIASLDEATMRPESSFLTSRRDIDLTQSYYYPSDPSRPNWRPFSMQPYYIILLILISATLAGVQEWLCQHSLRLQEQSPPRAILEFDRVASVSLWSFFCWKYLPTLIFVTYGVFWQIMDFEIRRLEPFYQLSQPNGSTAEESLNIDYLTLFNFLVPFKAIRYKHWAVLSSSIGTLLATSVSPPLQNPSVVFSKNKECPGNKCPEHQNLYFVRIQPVWSRCLSASLLLTAIFGTVLLFQLRRRSGLLSDPKGIAGIASMATKSHILNDFQGLDTADERGIHKRLEHRRYVLYKSSIWQGEYIQHSQTILERQAKGNPHPMILRKRTGWAFCGCLLGFLAFIPVVNFTRARVISNAAPWLITLIATLLKMMWTTLDFGVRMMEPFYILSRGNAEPGDTLTLDYRGTPYGILPLAALFHRHYLVALVGFCSILTDILTVTVSSFSVNGERFLKGRGGDGSSFQDETFKSFWVSVSLSLVITLTLIFSAILVYWRRGQPFLPRQPNTIASVLAFIFASNMLFDFVGTEMYSSRRTESTLKRKGKRYGLGWFTGFDKKVHVAVDEMPWRARYEFGRPHEWLQAPWTVGNVDELS